MKNKETLEEAAEKLALEYQLGNTGKIDIEDAKEMLIEFAKWQQERSYSEEYLKQAFEDSRKANIFEENKPPLYKDFEEWFKNK